MRGKKIDTEFLSEFIQECVQSGLDSPEDFANKARSEIANIDQAIKEVENKKVRRSKLLGVIMSFETPIKQNKIEESKILPFYNLSYPDICNKLCIQLAESGPIPDATYHNSKEEQLDYAFCFKQMIERHIICKSGHYFIKGKAFDSYYNFMKQRK